MTSATKKIGKTKETKKLPVNLFCLQVLEEPHPKAETVLFYTKDWPAAAVAVMNVVYAFSGQSAYIEIIAEMKGPHRFPSSLLAATGVMFVAYFGIGIAGYVSQVRLSAYTDLCSCFIFSKNS